MLPRRRMNAAVGTALGTGAIAAILLGVTFFLPPLDVIFGLAIGGTFLATIGFLFARHEIEITQSGLLRTQRRIGPFRRTKTRFVDDLTQLRIVEHRGGYLRSLPGNRKMSEAPFSMTRTSKTTDLIANFADDDSLTLAEGYPRHILGLLAIALKRALNASGVSSSDVTIRDTTVRRKDRSDDVERPADSTIEIEESRSATVLRVPPPGLTDRLRRLRMRSVLALVVGPGFELMFGLFAMSISFWQSWQAMLFIIVFMALPTFITVSGLWGYCLVWRIVRSEQVFRCEESCLHVATRSGIRSVERLIERHSIVELRAGSAGKHLPQNMEDGGNEPLPELQIWLRNGRGRYFMQGQDAEDIRWVAARIRRALRVPAIIEEALQTMNLRDSLPE